MNQAVKRKIHSIPALFIIFSASILAATLVLYFTQIASIESNPSSNLTSPYIYWKTYSNLTNNYSIRYPEKWQVSEQTSLVKFTSPNFSYGSTPTKKIEEGFFITIRVLPINSVEGYSGDETDFAVKKDIEIKNFQGTEYVVKNIDESEAAPAEIQFKTDKNLILIDGWFSSQDKDLFLNIFDQFTSSFKIT